MSTGTFLALSALKRIKVHSRASPADAESIEDTFIALNEMIHMWRTDDIDLNLPEIEEAGDELGEPPDTTMAIILNLAIWVSNLWDNGRGIVSPTLEMNARLAYNRMALSYRNIQPFQTVPSALLPKGEGNNKGFWNETFFDRNAVVDDKKKE